MAYTFDRFHDFVKSVDLAVMLLPYAFKHGRGKIHLASVAGGQCRSVIYWLFRLNIKEGF